jgi:hypothetical protein
MEVTIIAGLFAKWDMNIDACHVKKCFKLTIKVAEWGLKALKMRYIFCKKEKSLIFVPYL